jgi:hypothetical protein
VRSKRMQFPGGLRDDDVTATMSSGLLQAVGDPTRRQRQSSRVPATPSKAGANQSRPARERQPNRRPPVR